MKLIGANAVVTANLYDDEHEEFIQKKVTVGELVDFCSEEGCPKAAIEDMDDDRKRGKKNDTFGRHYKNQRS